MNLDFGKRSLENIGYIESLPRGKEKDTFLKEIMRLANKNQMNIYFAMEIILNIRRQRDQK